MDFTVRIFSQNLATMSNFFEFRDNRNFTFFETPRVTHDLWQVLSGSQCATCQVESNSNIELKWDP